MASQAQTIDEQQESARKLLAASPLVPILVVVWAADEGHLLGASLIPNPARPGVFGRGQPEVASDQSPLLLAWQYPELRGAPQLTNPKISRVQLLVRASGGGLEVENLGRCPLHINDREVPRGTVQPGDLVSLGNQVSFLCVLRPAWLSWHASVPPEKFLPGGADSLGLVGESIAAWVLRRNVVFVAERSGHVLIRGPSGSGKELIARAVHGSSSRRERPLISRNAATIPEGLVDAELFGNMKNYPNPGMVERPGLIGQAHGSSLFLDEFAELPPAMQAHLLRVLDAGEYQRLGEATPRSSDFRLIAATNRPRDAIKHDVLARFLHSIEVSGLDDRREDIPLLVRHLLRSIARSDLAAVQRFLPAGSDEPRITRELMLALVRRGYTTNVRELLALLWESIRNSRGAALEPWPELLAPPPLPARPVSSPPHAPSPSSQAPSSANASGLSPERIQATLDENNGSVEKSWRALGLSSRHVLKRLIGKFGIEVRRRSGSGLPED